jgi:hypothetical protein
VLDISSQSNNLTSFIFDNKDNFCSDYIYMTTFMKKYNISVSMIVYHFIAVLIHTLPKVNDRRLGLQSSSLCFKPSGSLLARIKIRMIK